MTLGLSAVAIPTLNTTLSQNQVTWLASMASLAAPIVCFLSGPIADKFGRKISIFCINVTCFIGWLAIYSAYAAGSSQYLLLLLEAEKKSGLELLVIARIVAVLYPHNLDPDLFNQRIWSQQDGAPPHFVQNVRTCLNEVFDIKIYY
ncbi:uncharacterized protein LOC108906701 [Anoplophora glabripennis]|uniref:uncharacterized protein LOC108906701 n=1 Tax=Anoplophora glabripennis TaxID=217634 RepID=UPI0008751FD8|nr:uncharacterized protein LOC108906701 [Anoplophora glabripennis]XP_018565564.1 uncharacterized protein LOC108906701 [Anoplophora glabripennis]